MRARSGSTVLALVVGLALLGSTGARGAGGPTVWLQLPALAEGIAFAPGETVTVTLRVPARTITSTVRASAHGRFRVELGLVRLDPCRGRISIVATGDSGSVARWSRRCRPPSVSGGSLRQ